MSISNGTRWYAIEQVFGCVVTHKAVVFKQLTNYRVSVYPYDILVIDPQLGLNWIAFGNRREEAVVALSPQTAAQHADRR